MTTFNKRSTQVADSSEVVSSLDNHKAAMIERGSLHEQKKVIEARIKELDAELRPVLAGRGAVVSNGFQHEVVTTAGRKSYDTKQMIADGHDELLEQYAKVGAPSTRYTVKKVQEV